MTNVGTCCVRTRKVTYASAMSFRMKPWEYETRHAFKIADEDEILLLLLLLCRCQILLRLVNVHLLTQKVFLFVVLKSSKLGFVVEARIIANCLGKFLVENSILRLHFRQY